MTSNHFGASFVRRWKEGRNCRSSERPQTGLEAVHKAEELKPDLILLDIGLPVPFFSGFF